MTLQLRESEILASCRHGCVDLLSELLVAIILGKVKFCARGQPCARQAQGWRQRLTVEASVRAGQAVLVAIVTMDVEATEAVHAFKLTEAVQRHFACARNELQELRSLFLVEGANGTPEPLDLRRGCRVVMVFAVVLPVVDVDIWKSRNEQFEFLFVENGNQFGRNDIVEACRLLAGLRTGSALNLHLPPKNFSS